MATVVKRNDLAAVRMVVAIEELRRNLSPERRDFLLSLNEKQQKIFLENFFKNLRGAGYIEPSDYFSTNEEEEGCGFITPILWEINHYNCKCSGFYFKYFFKLLVLFIFLKNSEAARDTPVRVVFGPFSAKNTKAYLGFL